MIIPIVNACWCNSQMTQAQSSKVLFNVGIIDTIKQALTMVSFGMFYSV